MRAEAAAPLRDPMLSVMGVEHGFGQRGSPVPPGTHLARQIHGTGVLDADEWASPERSAAAEADAVVSGHPGRTVGIVTADCVPILVAWRGGERVAAIHAGWRGLAAGVIERGLAALAGRGATRDCVAAVGPAARACCYEVDGPVREALLKSYKNDLTGVLIDGRRPGRFQLDLPGLAERVLARAGVPEDRIGGTHRVCTICDPERFESFRRDGGEAGRLRHFVTCSSVGARSA